MSLINWENNILWVGATIAIILLMFPKLNYIIKAVLIALTTIFFSYISINLLALNISSNDPYGIITLIALTYGGVVSIFSGLIVLAIFVFKNEKMSRIIAKIFNNN